MSSNNAIQFAKHNIKSVSLSHSLLVTGGKSPSQREFAKDLAKALNCSEGSFFQDCGCASCSKIESGNHPDVRWYESAEDSTKIKIADIKNLIHWVSLKPFEGRRKVFIVADAHEMTMESQNALLKTLEEPPPQSTIILTTDHRSSLLDTITSRCTELKLETVVGLEPVNSALIGEWQHKGSWEFFSGKVWKTREELEEAVDALIRHFRDELVENVSSQTLDQLKNLLAVRESLEDNVNTKIVANYLATL